MDTSRLTEGVIWKKLLFYFFPILLGAFIQQFYTIADAIIVGQFAGKNALAAVDAASPFMRLFVNMFTGLATGVSIIVAQLYGAGRFSDLRKASGTATAFAFIAGAAVMLLGLAVAGVCLEAMQVPGDLQPLALDYARISFAGMVPMLVYNIGAGILRAVGDAKRPFYFLVIGCLLNIGLDYLFIGLWGWGAAGAAWATNIAQSASAALVIAALTRAPRSHRLCIRSIGVAGPLLKKIIATGMPVALQLSTYPFANMLVQSGINQFGTDAIAAWAISGKLDVILGTVMGAFGVTISNFAAQNYGAGKIDRVLRGARVWMAIGVGSVGLMTVALYAFCRPLAYLFIDDEAVVALSVHVFRFIAPFYCTYLFGEILSGVIRGAGETFRPMLIAVFGVCVLRVVWILLAVPYNRTLDMTLACYPITWVFTSAALVLYYFRFRRGRLQST